MADKTNLGILAKTMTPDLLNGLETPKNKDFLSQESIQPHNFSREFENQAKAIVQQNPKTNVVNNKPSIPTQSKKSSLVQNAPTHATRQNNAAKKMQDNKDDTKNTTEVADPIEKTDTLNTPDKKVDDVSKDTNQQADAQEKEKSETSTDQNTGEKQNKNQDDALNHSQQQAALAASILNNNKLPNKDVVTPDTPTDNTFHPKEVTGIRVDSVPDNHKALHPDNQTVANLFDRSALLHTADNSTEDTKANYLLPEVATEKTNLATNTDAVPIAKTDATTESTEVINPLMASLLMPALAKNAVDPEKTEHVATKLLSTHTIAAGATPRDPAAPAVPHDETSQTLLKTNDISSKNTQDIPADLFNAIKELGSKAAVSAITETPIPTNLHINTPLTTSASPVTTLSVKVPVSHAQWGPQLSDKVAWMGKNNVSSAEIQVNPSNLGPVSVKVHVNANNEATISFVSQHGEVRDSIENALPKLRETLESSGIQLASVNVGDKSTQQQTQTNEKTQTTHSIEDPEDEQAQVKSITPLVHKNTVKNDGSVDYYV